MRSSLSELNDMLQSERALPPAVIQLLREMPEDANPMSVLQTAVAALGVFDGETDDASPEANYRKAIRLTARIPTLIAAFDRIRKGQEPVAPLSGESTAHNFVYMLTGEEPGAQAERIFDACLTLHAEHGLNASTFTARVIGSTLSDMYSATAGAIGALKGPLHGGANIKVMQTLLEIDASGKDPREWVKEALGRKERIMGFGHRVYKTFDPRARLLRETSESLADERGQRKWYDISVAMMETVKSEKGLDPNVDFFSASVYYMLGIDTDLYTPIFALARITGWTAHLLEQWEDNRLIRPSADYIGQRGLTFPTIDQR